MSPSNRPTLPPGLALALKLTAFWGSFAVLASLALTTLAWPLALMLLLTICIVLGWQLFSAPLWSAALAIATTALSAGASIALIQALVTLLTYTFSNYADRNLTDLQTGLVFALVLLVVTPPLALLSGVITLSLRRALVSRALVSRALARRTTPA